VHQVVEVVEHQMVFPLHKMEHLVLQVEVQEMLVLDQQGEQVLLALKVMVVEVQEDLNTDQEAAEVLEQMELMEQHLLVE
tara:strand:+ start:35 stop:274 length:240 start_codon:yes stop_codon:yes gene_type:complete